MSGSIPIIVIAAVVVGIILVISFNIAWYRRQKQRQAQMQTSGASIEDHKSTQVPAENTSQSSMTEQGELQQDETRQEGTSTSDVHVEETKQELVNDRLQTTTKQQDENTPASNWWYAGPVEESSIKDIADALRQFDQNPHILGWVVWDERILGANRRYDTEFLDAISGYVTAVDHLQKELHMKQFLTANIKGADGVLLLRKEHQVWVALIMEDETKLT
jgi:uncharacterized membrane-anchored protein YhcB (DUF1043 family)